MLIYENLRKDRTLKRKMINLSFNLEKKILLLQRLNLGGTKFVSSDTFCRTIFTLKIFVLVLCSKIHNAENLDKNINQLINWRHLEKSSHNILQPQNELNLPQRVLYPHLFEVRDEILVRFFSRFFDSFTHLVQTIPALSQSSFKQSF
ncbi:hypothetical protein BpHYR1_038293 [Brachionus plicatilis]|uniref:Uncharacterized protein n=1 Tax=Brachionus plicatilis TaxID=10195 RepID=A0A3M7SHP9_BRAPC|nr:hypothetical protein BpHYR1_038293 [Brachionus plicatilis]